MLLLLLLLLLVVVVVVVVSGGGGAYGDRALLKVEVLHMRYAGRVSAVVQPGTRVRRELQ
jgi:hypothetical protein